MLAGVAAFFAITQLPEDEPPPITQPATVPFVPRSPKPPPVLVDAAP